MSALTTIASYVQHKWDHVATKGSRRALVLRRHDRNMRTDPEYRRQYAYGEQVARAILSQRAGRYRSAKESKVGGGPSGPWSQGGSADSHVLGDWQPLAERARQLLRDDPLASSIRQRFLKNVMGSGMRPQARTGDPDKDQRLEKAFALLTGDFDPVHRLSFPQFQRLIFSTGLFDGESMLRMTVFPGSSHMQFELIESDRIMTPMGVKPEDPQGRILHGVEKDRFGRIVAYFIRKEHPREVFGIAGATPSGDLSLNAFWRVLPDTILRFWEPERAGQTRGISSLHAIITDIRDLDFLMKASLDRVNISAALSVFVKSPQGLEDLLGTQGLTDELANESKEVLESAIEPGSIYHLFPGEEIQTLVPNFPTPELMPFVEVLAMRVAAAMGITWEEVLGNYSKDNYSTARTALLDSRLTYDWVQKWFTISILTPMWTAVHEHQRLRNVDPATYQGVTDEDLRKVEWIGPGRGWIDPLKEAKADVEALKAGILSFRDILSRRGEEYQEHFAQLAREKEELEKLGLESFIPKPKDAGAAPAAGTTPAARELGDAIGNAIEDAVLLLDREAS